MPESLPTSYRHEATRITTLAVPVVAAQIGFMLLGVVDTVMVGRMDGAALAGIALGNTWSFFWMVLGRAAAMGLDPWLTQAHGARSDATFGRALAHGSVLLLLLAVVITVLHGGAAAALGALGQPAGSLGLAQAYAWAVAPSAIPLLGEGLLRQSQQAQGRMRPAVWVALLGNLLNVPLNLLFMQGWGSVPGWGPVGVGWSTTVLRWIMFAATVALAWPDVRRWQVGLKEVTWRRLVQVAGIALPVGVQTSLEVGGFTVASLIAGWFGEVAVAAHTVTLQLASMAFMVPLGIGAAAATRVGNLVGAGRDWRRAAVTSIGLGALMMGASALVYRAIPGVLVALYVPDHAGIADLAEALLMYAALFQVFDGVQVVSFGVLRGLGDTRVPSLANIVGYYLLGLPLGAALAWCGDWGPAGVWVGLSVALGTVAILLVVRIGWLARSGLRPTVWMDP